MSERSVIRAVKLLAQRGHLKIDPGKAGRGYSNQYFMVLQKGVAADLKPAAKPAPVQVSKGARKPASVALKPAPAQENYLEPSMGPPSAVPLAERERELALAVIPASAPAPVGGALEGNEVAVDRFPDLWALWSSARSWPDSALDEFVARRSFDLARREADPDDIIARAQAWVSAIEPRYIGTLSKWLLGRGWTKQPPARRQRNGKVSPSSVALEFSQQFRRAGH
jgi:hypothetical protein